MVLSAAEQVGNADEERRFGMAYEAIAIVGTGLRLPGGSENLSAFSDFVRSGADAVGVVPPDRWHVGALHSDDEQAAGRVYVERGGFLDGDFRAFDAAFFGMSPREAGILDPQQRLVLEVAYECLTDARADFGELAGSNTGVFVGGFMTDHLIDVVNPSYRERIGPNAATSATLTMLSNRLSFTLGLRGPSLTVDTACSSSLVATHLACRALQAHDADLCLAGGVNAMIRPETTMMLCKGQFLARDGRSKSFDASADGYGRGEGCGFVALKRLTDAEADGDDVLAVIRGSGVNQDGATPGITVPSAVAQADLMTRVYDAAGVDPAELSYLEAHGTGTPVGDPIEVAAIRRVAGGRHQQNPTLIGSVKAGIGHLEAAAGVAGLLKAVATVRVGEVGPQAWFRKANPALEMDGSGLELAVDGPRPLPDRGVPPLIGVNSFGYGGTNAHVLVGSCG